MLIQILYQLHFVLALVNHATSYGYEQRPELKSTCPRFSFFTDASQYTSPSKVRDSRNPHCDVSMDPSNRSTRSKYFPSGDASSSTTSLSSKSKRSLVTKKQQNSDSSLHQQEPSPSLSSRTSDDTLPYSIGASYSDDYSKKDFVSDDDSDGDADETEYDWNTSTVVKKRKEGDISDDSSDDEETARPWRQDTVSQNKRQTTLNFGARNSVKNSQPKRSESTLTRSKLKYSDMDTEEYRLGYPGKQEDLSKEDNLLFYKGKIESHPDGDFIYNIHQQWFGKYKLLERHHGYIQWLFPIREHGMNWQAQVLQLHEAKAIRADKEMRLRVLSSYRLMLDFYGMKLVDDETGQIQRSSKWKERFENLSWSTHNYLRITRILKSLGELGFERLKKPFLEFVLREALIERTLTRLVRSCEDYWIGTVKEDSDRELLHQYVKDNKKHIGFA